MANDYLTYNQPQTAATTVGMLEKMPTLEQTLGRTLEQLQMARQALLELEQPSEKREFGPENAPASGVLELGRTLEKQAYALREQIQSVVMKIGHL